MLKNTDLILIKPLIAMHVTFGSFLLHDSKEVNLNPKVTKWHQGHDLMWNMGVCKGETI